MKKHIGKIIHIIAFCLIFIIVFNTVSDIMMAKNSRKKYKEFFSSEENYDVVFMGSSLVLNAVVPMQLYHNYGIASYNFGNHASLMPVTYYTLLNVLNYTTPKVVVLDIAGIGVDGMVNNNISYAHTTFDYMPLSLDKLNAINSLFTTLDEKVEMTIPFVKYHSRWKDISSSDFGYNLVDNGYKGAEPRIRIEENMIENEFSEEIIIDETYTLGKEYLEKTIAICKEQGIEVVLTLLPHTLEDDKRGIYNYGYLMAEEYNVPYIDFNSIDEVVNFDYDFYDLSGHLNPSGAKKITDYLGKYLSENYELFDRRQDETYESWNEDYEKYVSTNISNLNSNREKINEYLMLCNNDDFKCTISLSEEITEKEYTLIHKLIDNIPDVNIVNVEGDADISITVNRKTNGEQVSSAKFRVNEDVILEAVE